MLCNLLGVGIVFFIHDDRTVSILDANFFGSINFCLDKFPNNKIALKMQ
jgi:hypothetical protein